MKAKFYYNDENGNRVIPNITDASITEDGIPRKITKITCPTDKFSLSVCIMVDTYSQIGIARGGAEKFISYLQMPPDEVGITYMDKSVLIHRDFTRDRKKANEAAKSIPSAPGVDVQRMFYSEKTGGVPFITTRKNDRKVLILVSDLHCPNLNLDEARLYQDAKAQGIRVFSVLLNTTDYTGLFKRIAENTNGEVFVNVRGIDAIYNVFEEIARKVSLQPCEIEWESGFGCTQNSIIKLNILSTIDSAFANKDPNTFNLVQSNPSILKYANLNDKQVVDTVIKVYTNNREAVITDIKRLYNNTDFEIIGFNPPYKISKFDTLDIKLRLTNKNKYISYELFTLISDACNLKDISLLIYNKNTTLPKVVPSNIKVLFPNGGEKFIVGTDTLIKWDSVSKEEKVDLSISKDGGQNWSQITMDAQNHIYNWKNVSKPVSDLCLIKASIPLSDDNQSTNNLAYYKIDTTLSAYESYDNLSSFRCIDSEYFYTYSKDTLLNVRNSLNGNINIKNKIDFVKNRFNVAAYKDEFIIVLEYYGFPNYVLYDLKTNTSSTFYSPKSSSNASGLRFSLNSYSLDFFFFENDSIFIYNIPSRNYLYKAPFPYSKKEIKFCFWDEKNDELYFQVLNKLCKIDKSFKLIEIIDLLIAVDYYSPRKLDKSLNLFYIADIYGNIHSYNLLTKEFLKIKNFSSKTLVDFSISNIPFELFLLEKSSVSSLIDEYFLNKYKLVDDKLIFVTEITSSTSASIPLLFNNNSELNWSNENSLLMINTKDGLNCISAGYRPVPLILQSDISDAVFSIIAPEAQFQKIDIDMGEVLVGSSKDAMESQVLCNTGDAPLHVLGVDVTNGNTNEFMVPRGAGDFYLAPKECRDMMFAFMPTQVGPRSAKITVRSTIGNYTDTINIKGVGVQPSLQLNSSLIDFGNVLLGTTKDTVDAVISNNGTSAINISSISNLTNKPNIFTILEGGDSFTLQPGRSHNMKLRFSPQDVAQESGRLGFNYNGVGSPLIVDLFGTGIGDAVFSIKSDSAYIGEDKILKIELGGIPAKSLKILARSYEAKLKFNKLLLSSSSSLPTTTNGDSVVVSLKGDFENSQDLNFIPVKALLGNTDVTSLSISDLVLKDKDGDTLIFDIIAQSGQFKILGICEEGGKRFIDGTKGQIMFNISPNPVSNQLKIDFALIEEGNTEIAIYNQIGEKVKTIFKANIDKPLSGTELIYLNEFSNGVYSLVLNTPTYFKKENFILTK
jgi:hypothetical protein